jgi:hypothetical protein
MQAEEVNGYEAMREVLDALARSAQAYHGTQSKHFGHSTPYFRTCPNWLCKQQSEIIEKWEPFARPKNYNKRALRNWLRNLQKKTSKPLEQYLNDR